MWITFVSAISFW